ncbi:MAG: PfaD family polyunsaturated fatty acid/polyketide biosynthesis protein [Polyangiaceae bacterium]
MQSIGVWTSPVASPAFRASEILESIRAFREVCHVVRDPQSGAVGVARGGKSATTPNGGPSWPLLATLPGMYPEWLGDRGFCESHGVRFPYVAGAMANGIASARLVIAMAEAGFLSFFGAAGLSPSRVESALDEIEGAVGHSDRGGASWGANLIHSPNEPAIEEAVSELYVRRGVRRVSAAAYMGLTPFLVRYAAHGLSEDAQGRVVRRNHVFAKISRPEVAKHFLEPAPTAMLQALVQAGRLSPTEARLAARVPVAEDITVESDSGGHTDNRPLAALLPTILQLRDRVAAKHDYPRPIRVGAAGGIGTPGAVAAAFALGAAYVLTGSVNQAAIESGLSDEGKQMLALAGVADVVMAPAADMFELGVEVQVLRRGSLFGVRAKKLYEAYKSYASLDTIPAEERARIERDILQNTFEGAWSQTREFWSRRDPAEVTKAEADPKHKMALVFRSYLGLASRWAIDGLTARKADYQIWCGPAMGAFNAWSEGTFLAEPGNRRVVQIAKNLLEGAASISRAQQLRSYGVAVPSVAFDFRPRPLA